LNLSVGCVHRCGFCSIRAYPTFPGNQVVYLYADTPRRLAQELASHRQPPRAIYVSPATDPFPPIADIQEEALRVVEVIARHGGEAWLMTRGYIRPFVLRRLEPWRDRIKIICALTTLDRSLQRTLEPLAAPPRLRLRQIGWLRSRGFRVQVSLEPLIPGLTDTRTNLDPLLEALAGLGIRHVTTSYLFLRPGIRDNLTPVLEQHSWDEAVLDAFAKGPMLKSDQVAPARYLPKSRRQRGYAALMALAANCGITVSVLRITNPDFALSAETTPVSPRQELLAFPWSPGG
jgi:DNA repair photolyase